jgi:hypothetical protein
MCALTSSKPYAALVVRQGPSSERNAAPKLEGYYR